MKNIRLKRRILFGLLAFLSVLLSSSLAEAQVKYTAYHLPDPFQSPFEQAIVERPVIEPEIVAELPHLMVQGMVWGSKRPQAIINNTVVRKGEVIGGAEILDIREQGVYVLYEGREYILKPTILKRYR